MGTTWSVKLVQPPHVDLRDVERRLEAQLAAVIAQMSTWVADSEISRFNRAEPGSRHILGPEFATVLRYALSVAELTAGAYDPTSGTLVDLWGFGPSGPHRDIPDDDAIATACESVGWQRVIVDASSRSVRQPGGIRIDLSSVAKGFAVDQLAECLLRLGVRDCLVEIGGELRGEGTKPDGSPWWVALEQPDGSIVPALPETVIALHGLAVATSGDAQRAFEAGGMRFSHTLDPRTGYPVPDRLVSVSVLHPRAMCADALATALTVLGAEAGFTHACEHDLAARFVLRGSHGLEERTTPAFLAMLES